MKLLYATALAALTLAVADGLTVAPVTYTQIFAERVITLTERMGVLAKEQLPNKKGFLCFGTP